jgi:transposase
MEFRELSDEEWNFIKPFLPPTSKVGRPRIDDRIVINGSYKTAWKRLKRWQEEGIEYLNL